MLKTVIKTIQHAKSIIFVIMENEKFKKQLDELFHLFKKLVERYPTEEIPGISKEQMAQLKHFLENYDHMRDSISFEVLGGVNNKAMQQMIEMFINQLREQLGEDADFECSVGEPICEVPKINEEMTIEEIDMRLRDSNLSAEEIDQLLDKRTQLAKQKPDSIVE